MAELFTILSQEVVTEFVPPSRTREKHEVWARAEPSGVVFTFRVVPADYAPSHVSLIAHDLAQAMNRLADQPGVTGVVMQQDVNANNQVTLHVVVTVESTSGDSTTDVRLAYGESFDQRGYDKIAKARANLDAIEDL